MKSGSAKKRPFLPDGCGPELALRILARPETIASLGAKRATALRKSFEVEIRTVQDRACSSTRIEAALAGHRREDFRQPGMVLSVTKTSFGAAAPKQRWTPAISVKLEDHYDAMSERDAMFCRDDASITGLQMQQLQMRGLKPHRQQTRTASLGQARKIHAAIRQHESA